MKQRKVVALLIFIATTLCLTKLVATAEDEKEELTTSNRIVSVSTNQGLNPTNLTVKSGTTVIWVNHSRDPIEILFLDKQVTLACGSPINFFVGKEGAYESAKIPFGGTASLCFLEKGRFDYMFKKSSTFYPMSEREHKGFVLVQE
jgi:plastocyanin